MKRSIHKPLLIALTLTAGAATTPASAAVNCWATYDPIACYLQEWFGNGNTQMEYAIELPKPESPEYKEALSVLKENGFGKRPIPKREGPEKVTQICKPEELLKVAMETGSVQKTAETCFK